MTGSDTSLSELFDAAPHRITIIGVMSMGLTCESCFVSSEETYGQPSLRYYFVLRTDFSAELVWQGYHVNLKVIY